MKRGRNIKKDYLILMILTNKAAELRAHSEYPVGLVNTFSRSCKGRLYIKLNVLRVFSHFVTYCLHSMTFSFFKMCPNPASFLFIFALFKYKF